MADRVREGDHVGAVRLSVEGVGIARTDAEGVLTVVLVAACRCGGAGCPGEVCFTLPAPQARWLARELERTLAEVSAMKASN